MIHRLSQMKQIAFVRMAKASKLNQSHILLIDTTAPHSLWVAVAKGEISIARVHIAMRHATDREQVLGAIEAVLRRAKLNRTDLNGVVVVQGPGPFTATRIGVTVANAIGFALHIPVAGVKAKHNLSSKKIISQGRVRLRRTSIEHIVTPVYGSEPNISVSRRRTYS